MQLPSGGEPEDKLQSEAGFTQAEVDAMRSKKVVTLDVSALMKRYASLDTSTAQLALYRLWDTQPQIDFHPLFLFET